MRHDLQPLKDICLQFLIKKQTPNNYPKLTKFEFSDFKYTV